MAKTQTGIATAHGLDLVDTTALNRKNGSRKIYGDFLDRYGPSLIVVEGGYFMKNHQTAMILAEERGAVKGLAEDRGIRVIERDPSEWRSVLKIRGTRKQCKTAARGMARNLSTPLETRIRGPKGTWDRYLFDALHERTIDEIEATIMMLSEIRRNRWLG